MLDGMKASERRRLAQLALTRLAREGRLFSLEPPRFEIVEISDFPYIEPKNGSCLLFCLDRSETAKLS